MGRNQNRTYTITDDITGDIAKVDYDDIEAHLRSQFDTTQDGIEDAITGLVDAMNTGAPRDDHEAYLAITIR